MQFRPAVESDLDRVLHFGSDDPLNWPGAERHRAGVEDGSWDLSRTLLAVDGDDIVAMARFWAPPGHDGPEAMDGLYTDPAVGDRVALAAALLRHAHERFGAQPEYHVFLPASWREDEALTAAVDWRRAALAEVGLSHELERLRYKWTPDAGVPEPDPRVTFRAADDEAFFQAFCEVSRDSLDVGTQHGIAEHGVEAEAREHMGVYLEMPGDRDWWRLAYDKDDDLIGLAIPSANNGGPVVGYLGVVPGQRGKGYVDPLLGEITRQLADRGAESVTADTDNVNIPMARAFERAGYTRFATRLVYGRPAA